MRKKLLLGNWKMNLTIAEATKFAQASIPLVEKAKANHVLLGVAPTFLSLATVKQHNPGLIVSAQNIHFENHGAFTGEISVPMLKEIGIDWTLVGHSERRNYFGETNLICNKKMLKALSEGMTVVYCVGESSDDYDHGRTKAVIRDQLFVGLAGMIADHLQRVVIAYEPVWSIGTGKNASKEHAQDIANYIRERLEEMFNLDAAQRTLVLYGGSVKPNNIKDYLTQPDVDGALVGGASLNVTTFEELLTNMLR
ncbi:MAG: triosephosphate isomerase [Bacillota bacterium]|jgi:triosephosphate isomerase